jgi:hypothetical protein
MNNKNETGVDSENQELLSKIEKIEKENQRLAKGIGKLLPSNQISNFRLR